MIDFYNFLEVYRNGFTRLEDITEYMTDNSKKKEKEPKKVVTEEITDSQKTSENKTTKKRKKRRKKAMTPEELNRITRESGLSIDWNKSATHISEADTVDNTPIGMRPDGGRL